MSSAERVKRPGQGAGEGAAPAASPREVWVFGDYRNFFRNRVTLQLLSRGRELARDLGGGLAAVVLGREVERWAEEYIAHGADKVYLVDHPSLENYQVGAYVRLSERLVREFGPEVFLIGATAFGREFAPRLAKRLGTGLTADCVDLKLDREGRLVQTVPYFGGNLLAEIITPEKRPQMATVRPGLFSEPPHDGQRRGQIIHLPLPADLPVERVRLISSEHQKERGESLEKARVVVCGGRGVGSKKKFRNLQELARLMGGQVAATRPAVYADWVGHEALVGQAGKQIKPQVLFSFGVSGAIQHTAAIGEARFVVAVNKNPKAMMMKLADVGLVADANQVCLALIRELRARFEKQSA